MFLDNILCGKIENSQKRLRNKKKHGYPPIHGRITSLNTATHTQNSTVNLYIILK